MHQPINDPSLMSSGNFGPRFIAIRAKQLLTANINRALVNCFSSCLERCHWEGNINICRSLALSRPILTYFPVSNWAEWVPGSSQMESLKVAWTFLRCIWIIKAKIDCEDQKYLCPRAIYGILSKMQVKSVFYFFGESLIKECHWHK